MPHIGQLLKVLVCIIKKITLQTVKNDNLKSPIKSLNVCVASAENKHSKTLNISQILHVDLTFFYCFIVFKTVYLICISK